MLPRLQQKKVKCTSHLNFFEGLVLKYEGQNVKGQGHMGSSISSRRPIEGCLGPCVFCQRDLIWWLSGRREAPAKQADAFLCLSLEQTKLSDFHSQLHSCTFSRVQWKPTHDIQRAASIDATTATSNHSAASFICLRSPRLCRRDFPSLRHRAADIWKKTKRKEKVWELHLSFIMITPGVLLPEKKRSKCNLVKEWLNIENLCNGWDELICDDVIGVCVCVCLGGG